MSFPTPSITPSNKNSITPSPMNEFTIIILIIALTALFLSIRGFITVQKLKKEAESQAAKSTLARLGEFFGLGLTEDERGERAVAQAQAKADKATAIAQAKADKVVAQQLAKAEKAQARAAEVAERERVRAQKRQRLSLPSDES